MVLSVTGYVLCALKCDTIHSVIVSMCSIVYCSDNMATKESSGSKTLDWQDRARLLPFSKSLY